jgi:hypothetical protein|nr:hypothetical protein [Candidatus Acidoferrales bacterium]
MQINKKSAIVILEMFAAVATVFLIASGAAPTEPAYGATAGPHTAGPTPQTADSTCSVVLAALDKNFTVPYHAYMTQTSAAMQNGKPISTEMVYAGGKHYVLYDGKWTASEMSDSDMKAMQLKARQTAKNLSCHYVKDETVNGESAALFTTHGESEHGKDDNQIWISKSKGVILKQETDIDIGAGRPKTHMSVRYDYANVQAPKM